MLAPKSSLRKLTRPNYRPPPPRRCLLLFALLSHPMYRMDIKVNLCPPDLEAILALDIPILSRTRACLPHPCHTFDLPPCLRPTTVSSDTPSNRSVSNILAMVFSMEVHSTFSIKPSIPAPKTMDFRPSAHAVMCSPLDLEENVPCVVHSINRTQESVLVHPFLM